MAQFALMLNHAPDRYQDLSEDEYLDIIKDYVAWVEEMTAKGVYTGGHKLTEGAGRTLTANDGAVEVHDGPFAELAEVLGGLMIIEAADYDAAVEIAKTCPHLVHNRSLEIRQIDDAVED